MHVMNALVAHGALVVDMTNGGEDLEIAQQLAEMWDGIGSFYDRVDSQDDTVVNALPPMTTIMDTGSATAMAGYASYDHDSLQFLETRRNRETGDVLPAEAVAAMGESAVKALSQVFDAVNGAGKRMVQVAVAASSIEAEAFGDAADPNVAASEAAKLMTKDLLDDGSSLDDGEKSFPICMSPHRICRYSNNEQTVGTLDEKETDPGDTQESKSSSREVFGAHLDSTWVTIVPVAAVSGLEVFDETEDSWFRPELAARQHWESLSSEQKERENIPWHCRYVVLIPGELLQIATRNEVPAAVHRVVATANSPSRLSAPILLRCRPGVKMDVPKYFGNSNGDPLLEQCNGMTIEEIHAALTPTSFQ